MAPSVDTEPATVAHSNEQPNPLKTASKITHKEPLRVSGVLSSNYFDVTSVIGREYPDVQLSELMNSARRDEYIRDLAITGMCRKYLKIMFTYEFPVCYLGLLFEFAIIINIIHSFPTRSCLLS